MDKKKNAEQVEQAIQAVGAMAEMGLTFYRAAVGVGADAAEATRLTQAYLRQCCLEISSRNRRRVRRDKLCGQLLLST